MLPPSVTTSSGPGTARAGKVPSREDRQPNEEFTFSKTGPPRVRPSSSSSRSATNRARPWQSAARRSSSGGSGNVCGSTQENPWAVPVFVPSSSSSSGGRPFTASNRSRPPSDERSGGGIHPDARAASCPEGDSMTNPQSSGTPTGPRALQARIQGHKLSGADSGFSIKGAAAKATPNGSPHLLAGLEHRDGASLTSALSDRPPKEPSLSHCSTNHELAQAADGREGTSIAALPDDEAIQSLIDDLSGPTPPSRGRAMNKAPTRTDTAVASLFVGNVPSDADEADIKSVFDGLAVIVNVTIPRGRALSGGPRYAFVRCKTVDQACSVLEYQSLYGPLLLLGQPIRLEPCKGESKLPAVMAPAPLPPRAPSFRAFPAQDPMRNARNCKIFATVGALAFLSLCEAQERAHQIFGRYGEIKACYLVTSKPHCLHPAVEITYTTHSAAAQAIAALNGDERHQIRARYFEWKEDLPAPEDSGEQPATHQVPSNGATSLGKQREWNADTTVVVEGASLRGSDLEVQELLSANFDPHRPDRVGLGHLNAASRRPFALAQLPTAAGVEEVIQWFGPDRRNPLIVTRYDPSIKLSEELPLSPANGRTSTPLLHQDLSAVSERKRDGERARERDRARERERSPTRSHTRGPSDYSDRGRRDRSPTPRQVESRGRSTRYPPPGWPGDDPRPSPTYLEGSPVARSGREERGRSPSRRLRSPTPPRTDKGLQPTNGLWIRGPSIDPKIEDINEAAAALYRKFSRFGPDPKISIPPSRWKARGRGSSFFVFIRFRRVCEAQYALAVMDGYRPEWGGRLLVKFDDNASPVDELPSPSALSRASYSRPRLRSHSREPYGRKRKREPSPARASPRPRLDGSQARVSATHQDVGLPVKEAPSIKEGPSQASGMEDIVPENGTPGLATTPNDSMDGVHDYRVDELKTFTKRYKMPEKCITGHPGSEKARRLFKFEKLKEANSQGLVALESVFEKDELVLTIADDGDDALVDDDDNDDCIDNQISPTAHNATETMSPEVFIKQEPGSTTPLSDRPQHTLTSRDHSEPRRFPYEPMFAYIDTDAYSDLRHTLNTFLSVFLKLFEESRGMLVTLYDTCAVFSNLLAKQGCTASGVTKSVGWQEIIKTIQRLPPLTHGPLANFVVDASTVPDTTNLICTVHGSFTEFQSGTQRAFDRVFVLRPADSDSAAMRTHGVSWVVLSDTIIIRKFNVSAWDIVDSLRSQALDGASIRGSSPSPSREYPEALPAGSPGLSRPVSPRPTLMPPAVPPTTSIQASEPAGANPISQPDGQVAVLAAQLQVIQSTLSALVAQQQQQRRVSVAPSTYPAPPVEHQVDGAPVQNDPSTSALPSTRRRDFSLKALKCISSSLKGHGAKKRLILPADDLNVYLGISFHGDVVAAHNPKLQTPARVETLRAELGTSTVDSALYSPAHHSLVVGHYTADKEKQLSFQITISELFKTRNGDIKIKQEKLTNKPHERGPACMTWLQDPATSGDELQFATAGYGKEIVLWKVRSHYAETQSVRTHHTNTIRSIVMDNTRGWILSGGEDGRFLAHDLETQNLMHKVKDRGRIHQIVENPDEPNYVLTVVANEASGKQFRLFDLRVAAKPVKVFGIPVVEGESSSLSLYRKGAAKRNQFAFAGPDERGNERGVRVWDLRNLKTAVLDFGRSRAVQPLFENEKRMVVLEKDYISWVDLG